MKLIGVDIGGTGIKSALIYCKKPSDGSTFKIMHRSSVPTEARFGREHIVENICKAIDNYRLRTDCSVIGIGSAGDIDDETGVVTYATSALPGFTGLNLRGEIKGKFGGRVVVVNDAAAALIGEVYVGGCKGERPMMLTLGTGLGCAMIEDKSKLGSGSVNNIRLGHYILHEGGRDCRCGNKGCAEMYVSATGLKLNGEEDKVEEILYNPKYAGAVDAFCADFSAVLVHACEKYNPDEILIGGGVVEMAEQWWDKLKNMCPPSVADRLQKAALGNRAALLGSAYAALNGDYGKQMSYNTI